MVYVLFETTAGFALFKVVKDGKLKDIDSLHESFQTPEGAQKVVKLKAFKKFKDTKEAMKTVEKMLSGKHRKPPPKFHGQNVCQVENEAGVIGVAKQMGHTDTTMLFKVYSRYVPNLTRQDGSAFNNLINAALSGSAAMESTHVSQ